MSTQSLNWVKVHQEYLDLVPRLTAIQYRSLKNSIKEDGLQVPIIINEDGVILDGHSRFQACKELKIKPTFTIKKFEDPDKEREFVVTSNLARRQLTLFQRGEVCFNFYERERATKYQRAGNNAWKARCGEVYEKQERLLNRFGKLVGTGPTTAHMITWLIQNADENTKELLRNEQLAIRTAYVRLKNPGWKPRSAYGTYPRHAKCLVCGAKTQLAKDTDCHVHAQCCCSVCRWGI